MRDRVARRLRRVPFDEAVLEYHKMNAAEQMAAASIHSFTQERIFEYARSASMYSKRFRDFLDAPWDEQMETYRNVDLVGDAPFATVVTRYMLQRGAMPARAIGEEYLWSRGLHRYQKSETCAPPYTGRLRDLWQQTVRLD